MLNQLIIIPLVIFFSISLASLILYRHSKGKFFPSFSWESMGLPNVPHVLSIFITKIKIFVHESSSPDGNDPVELLIFFASSL